MAWHLMVTHLYFLLWISFVDLHLCSNGAFGYSLVEVLSMVSLPLSFLFSCAIALAVESHFVLAATVIVMVCCCCLCLRIAIFWLLDLLICQLVISQGFTRSQGQFGVHINTSEMFQSAFGLWGCLRCLLNQKASVDLCRQSTNCSHHCNSVLS